MTIRSTKGFLAETLTGPPRLTIKQCEAVRLAMRAMLANLNQQHGEHMTFAVELLALASSVVETAVDSYPPDRSCVTCDYSRFDVEHANENHCRRWDSEIPDEVLDVGCDEHQDDGAPF